MAAPMAEDHVEIRHDLPNKGRGLFAVHDIAKGSVLFEEAPLVCSQFVWNSIYNYVACEFCLRSLESAESMCQRLAANPTIVLPHPENCAVKPEQHTRCPHCQVLYCSAECRDRAWNQYHRSICLGPSPGHDHPLLRLQEAWRNMHYPPETASIMLIVRMVATVRQATNKETTMAALGNFCRASVNEQEKIAHKLLGEQFSEQMEMLRGLLTQAAYDQDLDQWFTPEGFRSLYAMIGTNGQGIGTSSLSVWCHACDAMDINEEDRKSLDEFIDQLYVDVEKESGNFLNCEGSGLYTLQSTCNHSCEPNAEVTFPNNNSTLAVVALEDIKCGEEIVISYLGECQRGRSRHSRQKVLRENYLFTCTCRKCISDADEPDVTSDEDEDDEEMDEN